MPSSISFSSPLGNLIIQGSENGISHILYKDKKEIQNSTIPKCMQDAMIQLKAYFRGELKVFDLKLDLQGTEFQKKVWHSLLKIPYGKTISYKNQALQMNHLKAIRAIASANGKNPIPIIIPCHRVIGSDGTLTGYAGGLWRKKWLLTHENALKQQSLFK